MVIVAARKRIPKMIAWESFARVAVRAATHPPASAAIAQAATTETRAPARDPPLVHGHPDGFVAGQVDVRRNGENRMAHSLTDGNYHERRHQCRDHGQYAADPEDHDALIPYSGSIEAAGTPSQTPSPAKNRLGITCPWARASIGQLMLGTVQQKMGIRERHTGEPSIDNEILSG